MFGATAHSRDTLDTVDRLVKGFDECHAKLRSLDKSAGQVKDIAKNDTAITRRHHDTKIKAEIIPKKAMHIQAQVDATQRTNDERPSPPYAALPHRSQETLQGEDGIKAFACMLHDEEFSLQLLRHLGPEMACMLDRAIERQRVMEDSVRYEAHRALNADLSASRASEASLIAEIDHLRVVHRAIEDTNRALSAELSESRAHESSLLTELDGLRAAFAGLNADLVESRVSESNLFSELVDIRAAHQATEASQRQKVADLYAAQSSVQRELSALRESTAVDRDELTVLRDEMEVMEAEMNRLRADGVIVDAELSRLRAGGAAMDVETKRMSTDYAAIQADNTCMQNLLAEQRATKASLKEQLARLIAEREEIKADLHAFQSQSTSLKACLDDRNASIDSLRREVDEHKKAQLFTQSLLVNLSGFPPEGKHWEDLSSSLKLSRQTHCEPTAASWQWLQAWDDDAQPPEMHRSATAALCCACVCLHNWMDNHRRARDHLQSLVNSLETAAELPVGLCHTVLFAVLDVAQQQQQRPLRFDLALLLCQAAQLIASKCHSERRREAAAKVRAFVLRDCADGSLLDALLGGWDDDDDDLANRVPFCAPTLAQEGRIVYVQSIDSLLFVSRQRLRLRWISVRRIDWTKSGRDTIHVRSCSGDASQKVKFGQVGVELYKALLHL
ncbi:hypothetical protein BBO_08681 [Beauveria brongniartii RCEF 3172]|uniref:Uncharacterized protein n=1 Tax=Beauveria brongniartii RCEF 3172 TaxID=1081107 RepID=A0A166X5R4_9HYPO|nr:hypothetical protein BBO_08681 [Beauveria brongniartii RCEF 3172]